MTTGEKGHQRPPAAPGDELGAQVVSGATPARAGALTVTLPLPDRELCGNGAIPGSRGAKIARGKLVRAQREAAHRCASVVPEITRAAWEDRLPYFPTGRVLVAVEVWRDPRWSARRLDDDNLIRGLKGAMDGLTDAGVWADDRQVRWGAITWITSTVGHGAVLLTLTQEREG